MFGRTTTEVTCVLAWHSNWTEAQREQFRGRLAELEGGLSEEDLLLGMSGLGLEQGEGPDMFQCQLKLFSGWWKRWSAEEKNYFIKQIQPEN